MVEELTNDIKNLSIKKQLGQFYTTNYEYILQNFKIPDKIKNITEPFYGNGYLIKFIDKNSDMDWNQICDYVRKHNIVAVDDRVAFWEKEYLQNCNEHQLKWIGAFFEAHPFIEKMYVVFD